MINFLAGIKKKASTPKIEKFLYFGVLVALSLYVFSIPSFANRIGFNYICYGLIAMLIGLTVLYTFLFTYYFSNHPYSFLIINFYFLSIL